MPEKRLARARESLPEGYQFGDASGGVRAIPLAADEWMTGDETTFAIDSRDYPMRWAILNPDLKIRVYS